jgi:hypothetical protein
LAVYLRGVAETKGRRERGLAPGALVAEHVPAPASVKQLRKAAHARPSKAAHSDRVKRLTPTQRGWEERPGSGGAARGRGGARLRQ